MTYTDNPTHPAEMLHPAVIAPGAALLMAAFVTDIIYWRTLSSQWETFSIWLLMGGLIVAALAGLALVMDAVLGRLHSILWWRFLTVAVAALLSLLNAFIHSRDGYTAVVPEGIALSAVVTVLLLVVGWHGWSLRRIPPPNSSKPREVHT